MKQTSLRYASYEAPEAPVAGSSRGQRFAPRVLGEEAGSSEPWFYLSLSAFSIGFAMSSHQPNGMSLPSLRLCSSAVAS